MALTEKQRLCLKCKACCEEVIIPSQYPYKNKKVLEFLKVRALDVEKIVVTDKNNNKYPLALITIKTKCPHLKEKGCDIYENRPAVCKEYDGRPFLKERCLWSTLKE